MNNISAGMYRVLKFVATPLRFFALAITLLTSIIIVLAWKSALPADLTSDLIRIAFLVLISIIGLVTILVIFFPKKLVFDQEAHLTVLREQLGDNDSIGGMLKRNMRSIDAKPVNGGNR